MKRIYNDIPRASILYGIRGDQRILIRDWESVNAMHFRTTHGKGKYTVAFEGEEKDFHCWQYSKEKASKYYGMEVAEDGTLVFDICTAYEQY